MWRCLKKMFRWANTARPSADDLINADMENNLHEHEKTVERVRKGRPARERSLSHLRTTIELAKSRTAWADIEDFVERRRGHGSG